MYSFFSINNEYYSTGIDFPMMTSSCAPPEPSGLTADLESPTSFTAQWMPSITATNYFLDVATDAGFTAFVPGYENLAVGDVTSVLVTGVSPGPIYYWRVRAQNDCDTSANSAVADVVLPGAVIDRYVSLTGGNVAPYTNWATAAHTVQDAIDVAQFGETVWVSNGVYEGNVNFSGKRIRVASLYAQSGNPADIENTVLRGTGNGSVVSFTNHETAAAALIGFTITNGYANGVVHPFERGGGILCRYASPRLENLRLVGNRARHVGGGLYLEFSESAVRNVMASGNIAEGGAAVACYYADASLVNLTLRGNTATSVGGAITLYHATPVMRNLLVAGNTAAEKGGGLFFDASSPVIENLTCVGNSALYGGGLNVSYSSAPRLLNSVVWGNTPQQVEYDTRWYYMALSLDHVILQGGIAAIVTHGLGPVYNQGGVLNVDPQFADGDYRLAPTSPGRDSGVNQPWMSSETDLDGVPRVHAGTVDRGAYEGGSTAGVSGSLRCTILPHGVLSLGARWRVTTGPHTNWNESGATLHNLPAGPCTVVFQPVAGWTPPADIHPEIVSGVGAAVTGTYVPSVSDAQPPVIDSVLPADGHVTQTSTLVLTIAASDNQGVAKITVNGVDAAPAAPGSWTHTVEGLRGPYNRVTIQAYDVAGNVTPLTVNYPQADDLQLHAVHAGFWRVRNPWATPFNLRWEAVETTETGTGVVGPNSDFTFTTSPLVLNVNLFVNDVFFGTVGVSPAPAPSGPGQEGELDSDGDGMSNRDEDLAGTDPFSANSLFVVRQEEMGVPSPGPFVLQWNSSPENAYSVEISQDLIDWAVVPQFNALPGTGAVMAFTNEPPSAPFLRLRTWPLNVAP